MGSLSLDDDEEVEVGPALSLDDEVEPLDDYQPTYVVIKLDPDSPYNKVPALELQGMVMTWTVTNVTDFDAGTQANPGPAFREITAEIKRVKTLVVPAGTTFEGALKL